MKIVETSIRNRVGYIILTKPQVRNALDPDMVEALSDMFLQMESNSEVKVVVLKSAGEVFCAGADLKYLQKISDYSYRESLDDSRMLKNLFLRIFKLSKVVIAQVQGPAIAGGAGLVSVCDFAFASKSAKIGYSEVKIGFIPAIVLPLLLHKIPAGRAAQLLLSGKILTADQAYHAGLFFKIVDDLSLEDEVRRYAEGLCIQNSELSMQKTKKLLFEVNDFGLEEALELACKYNAASRTSPDFKKGISDFLSKKKTIW